MKGCCASRRKAGLAGLLAALLGACGGGSGPTTPGGAGGPSVPLAVSPADGATVDTVTPTLVVRNAAGLDAGAATYDFTVLAASGDTVIEEITGVPAGSGTTSATLAGPLLQGLAYRWKAVGRGSGRQAESAAARFEVGLPCADTADPWAKAVVDLMLSECTRRTNRRSLLDPANVLGAPDAKGTYEGNYENFLSLGEAGVVVVDMGACIRDGSGGDVRVYQYIEREPVRVKVAAGPGGPWFDLGEKECGEGGVPTRSNHCDFDLGAAGVSAARYVWVEDGERFACEDADTRTEGADIDAVEILNRR